MTIKKLWLFTFVFSIIQFLPSPFTWTWADPMKAADSIETVLSFAVGVSIITWLDRRDKRVEVTMNSGETTTFSYRK